MSKRRELRKSKHIRNEEFTSYHYIEFVSKQSKEISIFWSEQGIYLAV